MNNDFRIYNKEVYWTEELDNKIKKLLSKKYSVLPSHHYGFKTTELGVSFNSYKACLYGDIVEAEVLYDNVVKIIFRLRDRFNINRDLCFAVSFNIMDEVATVRTVWVNMVTDKHYTLDKTKYYNPF